MKTKSGFIFLLILGLSLPQFGMARQADYDEEARELAKLESESGKKERQNPAKEIASGVKTATYDSAAELLGETAEGTKEKPPVVGTLEGARDGGSKAVQSAAKGVLKVATLGYGDTENMKVEEPPAQSDEVTKFKINF